MRDSLTAPPGKQHPAVRSGDSPAHLDRASLRGGSSCHVVFGTDNLKEPQAAAAGLFPPHLPRLTCVKTSCWLISKAPSEATFSAVRSSFCSFPAGPGWTEPLPVRVDLACGGKGTLLLFHTAHRGKRTGFPPPSKTFVASCGAGQQRNSLPPLERDRSSFTFPSRTCWLSRVTWLFALLCQDPDPSVQTLEPLAGEVPHCTLGGRMK